MSGGRILEGKDRNRTVHEPVPKDRSRVVHGPAKRKDIGRSDETKFVQRGQPGGKPSRIYVQSTAPDDPEVGDLWVDTS